MIKFKFSAIILLLATALLSIAQTSANANKGATISKKDSLRLAKFKATGVYPVIKASKFSGVLPKEGITEKPDSNIRYKLLISLTTDAEGDKINEINRGLAEVGRILNLHIAAGIPKQNIDLVIVTHGHALFALLNNEAFKKQHTKAIILNIAIIKELENAGAKFIACGAGDAVSRNKK